LWDCATPVDITLACLPASVGFLSQTTPAGRHHLLNDRIRPAIVADRLSLSSAAVGRLEREWRFDIASISVCLTSVAGA